MQSQAEPLNYFNTIFLPNSTNITLWQIIIAFTIFFITNAYCLKLRTYRKKEKFPVTQR